MSSEAQCAACDTMLAGRWCHSCGQDTHARPRPLGEMAQEVFSEYSPIDSTWTRTAAALAVSPGRILTAYQRGASRLYVTPLKLFIGAIALFLILLGAFDLSLYQFVWKAERGQPQVAQIDRAGEVHIRGTWQDDRWLQQRLSPSIDPSVERALGSGPIKGIPKTVAI